MFLYDIIENKEAIILEEEIINKILNNFKKITSSQLSSNDTFNLIMAPYYKKYIIESFEYFINIIIFMEQNEAKKIRETENKNSTEKQNLKDSLTNMKLDLTNKIEYLQNEKKFLKKENSKFKKNENKYLNIDQTINELNEKINKDQKTINELIEKLNKNGKNY